MSKHGTFTWADLTVSNAEDVKNFYAAVIGWEPTGLDMGGYDDFIMSTSDGEGRVGICHARGANADIPPMWMLYVNVDDLDAAITQVSSHGGSLVTSIKGDHGQGRFVAIKDPAGAVLMLIENADTMECESDQSDAD